MADFSIASSREAFPALKQEQVFFDNAGGSQTLGSVIDSICGYLSKTNVQLGATYNISEKSTSLYSAGYEAAAKYINASPDNIGKLPTSLNFWAPQQLNSSAISPLPSISLKAQR
ncbi:hypothetical protein HYFRA_00006623 [Hymenoscyphus fraxineus]|uniref:Uncharacterized protein n=1 Tax=Hymenoscyphus fraxineus TaxID=746836 RepID=A0A9N9PHZ6_9HELO|nr:hypothetical protein HYFRA_00006623 [Hymenoscyphus fraxineus]